MLNFPKKKEEKNPIIFIIILYKPNFAWSISQADGFGPLWVLPNASWTNKSGIALNIQGVRECRKMDFILTTPHMQSSLAHGETTKVHYEVHTK